MKKLLTLLGITVCSLMIFSWCGSTNKVHVGDTISLSYVAIFADGQIFEENTGMILTVWSGQVIEGLDEDLVGMKIGKTKTITIEPEKWYGKLYDKNQIQKISQLIFDKLSITPKNWTVQKLWTIEGVVKWTEKDSDGNTLVLFDINPRQTWDTLQYKVTVIAKN